MYKNLKIWEGNKSIINKLMQCLNPPVTETKRDHQNAHQRRIWVTTYDIYMNNNAMVKSLIITLAVEIKKKAMFICLVWCIT